MGDSVNALIRTLSKRSEMNPRAVAWAKSVGRGQRKVTWNNSIYVCT